MMLSEVKDKEETHNIYLIVGRISSANAGDIKGAKVNIDDIIVNIPVSIVNVIKQS